MDNNHQKIKHPNNADSNNVEAEVVGVKKSIKSIDELNIYEDAVKEEAEINQNLGGIESEDEGCKKAVKSRKRYDKLRFFRYLLVSISGSLIQILLYTLFTDIIKVDKHVSFNTLYEKAAWLAKVFYDPETGKAYGLSYIIALSLAVVWKFTFNRKYTFKSTVNVPRAIFLISLYYAVFIPLSSWWVVELNKRLTFALSDKVALIIAMIANGVPNFLYQRYIVFNKTLDANARAKRKQNKEMVENCNEDANN